MRRREAAFRSYENEARRRATERESRPRQQRRASVVPPPLASQAAIAVFAAFEAAFERFEADVDGSELPMASLPWPPEDVPVSGVRRSDSVNPNPYNPHPNPSPNPNPRCAGGWSYSRLSWWSGWRQMSDPNCLAPAPP